MVEAILGNYLVESGRITLEELDEVMKISSSKKAAASFIATLDELLTPEQVAEIKKLPGADQHFGDVAVDEGYLTDEQVIGLLKKQTNPYFSFGQTLIERGVFGVEDLPMIKKDFLEKTGFNEDQLQDIKSSDVERIVPLYLTPATQKYARAVTNMIRTIINMVDRFAYIGPIEAMTEYPKDVPISQPMVWEEGIVDGFMEGDGGLLTLCSRFAHEEFTELDEEAIDGAGELLNCANGLFVSSLSRKGVYFELLPPICGEVQEDIVQESVARVPIYVGRKKMYMIVAELA